MGWPKTWRRMSGRICHRLRRAGRADQATALVGEVGFRDADGGGKRGAEVSESGGSGPWMLLILRGGVVPRTPYINYLDKGVRGAAFLRGRVSLIPARNPFFNIHPCAAGSNHSQ